MWYRAAAFKQLTQKSSWISVESHAWRCRLCFGTSQGCPISHNKTIFWLVFINLTRVFFSYSFSLFLPLVKAFGFEAEKEFFSCNSRSSLTVFCKTWVGGFTLWFGARLEITKSPTSGENIKWPLELPFSSLFFNLKLWCTPFSLLLNQLTELPLLLNVGVWEKHTLFFVRMSTPNITTPKKNINLLRK